MKFKFFTTLLLVLLCNNVFAFTEEPQVQLSFYGMIDMIYPKDSRIVIDDMSHYYSNASNLINQRGKRVSNIKTSLQQGVYVKYKIKSKPESSYIIDLLIISEEDYKGGLKSQYEN